MCAPPFEYQILVDLPPTMQEFAENNPAQLQQQQQQNRPQIDFARPFILTPAQESVIDLFFTELRSRSADNRAPRRAYHWILQRFANAKDNSSLYNYQLGQIPMILSHLAEDKHCLDTSILSNFGFYFFFFVSSTVLCVCVCVLFPLLVWIGALKKKKSQNLQKKK